MEQQEQDVAKAVVIIEEALRVAQSLPTPTDVRQGITSAAAVLANIDPDRALALVEAAYQEPARLFAEADAEASRQTDPAVKVALYVEAASLGDRPIPDDWVEHATHEPERFWPRIRESAEEALRPDWNGVVDAAVLAFPSRALEFMRRTGGEVRPWTVRELAAADPDLAVEVAREMPREHRRVHALCEIVRAIGKAAPAKADGIAREALATIRAPQLRDWRQQGLWRLACAWGPVNPEAALEVTQEIEGPSGRAVALASAAAGFAERDPARAVEVIDGALALVGYPPSDESKREHWQDESLYHVGVVLGRLDLPRALEVAAHIRHGYPRMLLLERLLPLVCDADSVVACAVLAELVRADYESGYSDEHSAEGAVVPALQRLWPEHADRIVAQLGQLAPQWRGDVTTYVLRAIAALDGERALGLAREEGDEIHRFWLLRQVAATIAPEDLTRALEVLAMIGHPIRREEAAAEVIGAIASADFEAARALAASLQHDWPRADALKHLAAAVVARDMDQAEAMLVEYMTAYDEEHDRYFDSWRYAWVVQTAAAILARADAHRAVAMLARVRDPDEPLWPLLSLARQLLGVDRHMTGEPENPPLP